jgi:hypothetical protein
MLSKTFSRKRAEIFTILHLFLSFTFRLDPNFEVKRNISGVMRAKDGIYMYAEKRQH